MRCLYPCFQVSGIQRNYQKYHFVFIIGENRIRLLQFAEISYNCQSLGWGSGLGNNHFIPNGNKFVLFVLSAFLEPILNSVNTVNTFILWSRNWHLVMESMHWWNYPGNPFYGNFVHILVTNIIMVSMPMFSNIRNEIKLSNMYFCDQYGWKSNMDSKICGNN